MPSLDLFALELLLLQHGFFVLLLWRVHHRPRVTLKTCRHCTDLNRVHLFFQYLTPYLNPIKPLLEAAKAPRGRPPLDHFFQFCFLIWHAFFGEPDLAKSLRTFNRDPELQKLLRAPVIPYYQGTLHRFIQRVGKAQLEQIHIQLIRRCHQLGIVTGDVILFDGYPLYSYLNTQKCLSQKGLTPKHVARFFQRFQFPDLSDLLPPRRPHAIPHVDKWRQLLLCILGNYPSMKKCVQALRQNKYLMQAVGFQTRPLNSQDHYKYLRTLKLANLFVPVEQRILAALRTSPEFTALVGDWTQFKHLEELRGVLVSSHLRKDAGAKLSRCISKNEYYWGRTGKILVDQASNLVLWFDTTNTGSFEDGQFTKMLHQFHQAYGGIFHPSLVIGDPELDSPGKKQAVKLELGPHCHLWITGARGPFPHARRALARLRLEVERVIGRLETQFHLEHPRYLGPTAVRAHQHLIGIYQTLQALYLHQTSPGEGYGRIVPIRG
jgi:hypothetical protein